MPGGSTVRKELGGSTGGIQLREKARKKLGDLKKTIGKGGTFGEARHECS